MITREQRVQFISDLIDKYPDGVTYTKIANELEEFENQKELESREFLCSWSEPYEVLTSIECGGSILDENRSFNDEERIEIKALKVDEVLRYHSLIIVRIK